MDGKRKRGDNWVTVDKKLLQQLVQERLEIIENKNNDTTTNQRKKKAWMELQDCFNDSCSGESRTVSQLKSQWTLQKVTAKKGVGENWIKAIVNTGGETSSSEMGLSVNENSVWLPNEVLKNEKTDSDDESFEEEDLLAINGFSEDKKEDAIAINNISDEKKVKFTDFDLQCRQELHSLQVENEKKRGRNLDLEHELIQAKLLYYKNKVPDNINGET